MEEASVGEKKPNFFRRIYEKKYKTLLIIPFLLLILAVGQISYQYMSTGDFFDKSVDLKGGVILDINRQSDIFELEKFLRAEYPDNDINVRLAGQRTVVEVDINPKDEQALVQSVETKLGDLTKNDYSSTVMGSSLGESFFRETLSALIIAFFFMGMIVFWYFSKGLKEKLLVLVITIVLISLVLTNKSALLPVTIINVLLGLFLIYLYIKYSMPSFAVILSAFSDIVVTLAIVNLLGIKLGTAGIAAFLMLIGYSVDTDILLSTKVLKGKTGTIYERTINAMKTGLTMSATTMIAIAIALSLILSLDIKQIMTIVLIGLCIDLINTWIQNAGLLRWHIEKQKKGSEYGQV
ncbi:hypothetical protein KY317_02245 [Candidatus Woesearchaeota archaeon]|nr:hypothetical protein [Candidatus Woesearchaeota archaeon]